MATRREILKYRRHARESFGYFVDYTYRWRSDYCPQTGMGFRLEANDAVWYYIKAIQDFRRWHSLNCIYPRGTGKTTLFMLAQIWTKWHIPWLQHLMLTATPDVATDCYVEAHYICREHPLLEHCRPINANESKRAFDVPGNRGKGRSFRWRTAGARVTGGRCHWLDIDDLEVKETVATPEQRMKMRLALSEAHNLLQPGRVRTWIAKAGTPWDADTIYRDLTADVQIEVPAIIRDPATGEVKYPFHVWTEESLRKRQLELKNDMMFHFQYLLDTKADDLSRPIKREQIVFEVFDYRALHNRCLFIDPAGGRKSTQELRAIRVGERAGDGMAIVCVGVKENRLYVLDVWSESTTATEFVNRCAKMARTYGCGRAYVESNYGGEEGWPRTIRKRFNKLQIPCAIEPYQETGKKLDRATGFLPPVFGDGQIVFHESLRRVPEIVDEHESQLLNLRWVALPRKDDVLDMLAKSVQTLHSFIHDKQEPSPTQVLLAQAKKANAPLAVQRMLQRRSGGPSQIRRLRAYG